MSLHLFSPQLRTNQKTENESGFTLIELITVIIILGVMAVVAVPKIATNGVGDFRATWAINEVKSAILYAQRHAIQTQVRTRVTFETGTNDIRLHRETTPNTNTWTAINSLKQSGAEFIIPMGVNAFQDVSITAVAIGSPAAQSVIFDRYGVPYDRGTVGDGPSDSDPPVALTSTGTVNLNGASGWQIQINPETGFIDMVDV